MLIIIVAFRVKTHFNSTALRTKTKGINKYACWIPFVCVS